MSSWSARFATGDGGDRDPVVPDRPFGLCDPPHNDAAGRGDKAHRHGGRAVPRSRRRLSRHRAASGAAPLLEYQGGVHARRRVARESGGGQGEERGAHLSTEGGLRRLHEHGLPWPDGDLRDPYPRRPAQKAHPEDLRLEPDQRRSDETGNDEPPPKRRREGPGRRHDDRRGVPVTRIQTGDGLRGMTGQCRTAWRWGFHNKREEEREPYDNRPVERGIPCPGGSVRRLGAEGAPPWDHPPSGSGYVPLLLAILLIIFGAILIVRGKGAPAFRSIAWSSPPMQSRF